jgi:hypothetical protein
MPDFAKQYEMMNEEQLLEICMADLMPAALAAYDAELRRRGTPECQRKLAEPGSASAQFNLGVAYDGGKSVSQDYAQAVLWYRKAAEQGFASAQLNLGVAYYEGQGVPQDYEQATVWFRKAAEQGDANAQFSLGAAYYDGRGVPQDFAAACHWLGLAESGRPEGIKAAHVKGLKADAGLRLAEQSSAAQGGSGKAVSAVKSDSTTILVCEKCDYEVSLSAFPETMQIDNVLSKGKRCPNGHRLQKVQSFSSAVAGGLGAVPACVVLGQAALAIPGQLGTTIFEFSLLIMIIGPIGYLVRALRALKKPGPAGRLASQYFGISLGWAAMFALLLYLTRAGIVPHSWSPIPF